MSFLLAPRLVCAGPRARRCRLCVLGSRLLRALTRNPVEHIASPRQRTQGIRSSAPYGALLAHLTLPRLACQGQGAGATVQEISYHKATAGHPQERDTRGGGSCSRHAQTGVFSCGPPAWLLACSGALGARIGNSKPFWRHPAGRPRPCRPCRRPRRPLGAGVSPGAPPPPARPAAQRRAGAHGLDRPRCWGGIFQRGFYTRNGMRDTSAARTSPTSLCTTA